jgi:hypothetical protein
MYHHTSQAQCDWQAALPRHECEVSRLGRATPCSQSQIGQDRYLGSWGAAQLTAVVVLSVAVRWGPVVTVVNGTLVARPVRATLVQLGGAGSTVTAE